MKPIFLRLTALVATLASAPTAPAAFNPSVVSADARWVVHVDLATLRDTELGKSLLTALEAAAPMYVQHGVRPDFEKILATAGSLTAYGTSFSQDPAQIDGTLVLQGTDDLRKIAEAFIAQATVTEPEKFTEIKGMPFEAYSLGGEATLAFPQERVIMFSKSQAQLLKAHEVMRGSAPSLAKKKSSVLGELMPGEGAYFVVAASEIPTGDGMIPTSGPHARILQMTTAAALALGEQNGSTSVRLQLMASSEGMAEKLERIVVGLAAMVSLINPDEPEIAELLRSVSSARKGNAVSISISYPSGRLVQLLQSVHDVAHRRMRTPPGGDDRHDHDDHNRGRADAASTQGLGRIVGTWHADADLPGGSPSTETMTKRTFDDVALKPGATIAIRGQRGGGEHARIDYIDIAPMAGGGAATRYEAEYQRLENYEHEKLSFASGAELVRMTDRGNTGAVKLRFQGAEGTYRVTIGFVDENDGQSAFALGVLDPAGVEAPAAQ